MSSDDQSNSATHGRGFTFHIIPMCWVCLMLLDAALAEWDATTVSQARACAACGGPATIEVRAPHAEPGAVAGEPDWLTRARQERGGGA